MNVVNNGLEGLEGIISELVPKLDSKIDIGITEELISLCRELVKTTPGKPKKSLLRKIVGFIKGGAGLVKDVHLLALVFHSVIAFISPDAAAHGVDVSNLFLG